MSRRTAFLLIRDLPHYRQSAFANGLAAVGFTVSKRPPASAPSPGDVLIIWNRYGQSDVLARRFEAAGARVVVAENGYLDIPGAKKTFSLALDRHNGLGRWPRASARADLFPDPDVTPWRDVPNGDALLLPQRGIGVSGVAMPRSWTAAATDRLRAAGFKRRIRVRPHPGGDRHAQPLQDDLDGVAFAVVWGSGAGVKAVLAGVPVLYELHSWIGKHAAVEGVSGWREPYRGSRRKMMIHVASSLWSVDEVAAGDPFRGLLFDES